MRGNSQNGGQTTKSLLTKPQCSGVPIQQAVSLSSSFPRHCLLFVCAFSVKCQKAQGRRNCPCPRSPAYKNRPGFHCGNRGGSFALFVLFQALTRSLAGVLDRSLSGCQNYRAFESQYRFTCPVRLRDSPYIFPSQSSILRGKELFREEDAESIHTETDASAVVKMVRQVFPSVQSGKTESFYG